MDRVRFFGVCIVVATLLVGMGAAARDLPSLTSEDLAQGPYARMHMLLEKTILNVDVATVDVRFGAEARDRIAALARGRSYSEARAERIARVAIEANDAVVQLEFERDVSFEQWLDSVRENLGRAAAADLIDQDIYSRIYHGLPEWFSAVRERGFEEGDRLLYRVRPKSLETALVSAKGKVYVRQIDKGQDPPRALLAGFLAPGVDFREGLIRSVFED